MPYSLDRSVSLRLAGSVRDDVTFPVSDVIRWSVKASLVLVHFLVIEKCKYLSIAWADLHTLKTG